MKKFILVPAFILVFIVLGIFWFYSSSKPVEAGSEAFQNFLIPKGTSASKVGNNLFEKGLIKSSLAFKIYVQVTGKSGSIQAGEYRLSPSFNLFQTVAQFGKGPVEIWVTIPEGLRREEIATKFTTALEKDADFEKEFLNLTKGYEGYLFPETYLFPKEATATAIVNKLRSTFDSKTERIELNNGLTLKETIILASIVERETKTNEERPVVAGILLNRLNIGMPLQVDATVQYVLGNQKTWWPNPTKADLEVISVYNTYKNAGLPPAPIASPGLSSIKAAANPSDSDYFYYIHDPKGVIHYAKTLSEQNANIQKYLY